MNFSILLVLQIASTWAKRTREEAAVAARELLYQEKIATLGSVYAEEVDKRLAGKPFGLISYYADCSDNGTPTLLLASIEMSMRNFLEGDSALALSISTPPSGPDFSAMQHGRMSMTGTVTKVTAKDEIERVEKCFLERHPDAMIWKPSTSVHDFAYFSFDIDSIYWLGGFGSVAFIGYIPVDIYQGVKLDDSGKEAQHEVFHTQKAFVH